MRNVKITLNTSWKIFYNIAKSLILNPLQLKNKNNKPKIIFHYFRFLIS